MSLHSAQLMAESIGAELSGVNVAEESCLNVEVEIPSVMNLVHRCTNLQAILIG